MIHWYLSKPGTMVRITPHTVTRWDRNHPIAWEPTFNETVWAIKKNPDMWKQDDGQELIPTGWPCAIIERCLRDDAENWYGIRLIEVIDGEVIVNMNDQVWWLRES